MDHDGQDPGHPPDIDTLGDRAETPLRLDNSPLPPWSSHGAERVNAACQRALAVDDPSYRTVKGILAAKAENAPLPGAASRPATDVPALLRGPAAIVGHLPTPNAEPHHDDPDREEQAG